MHAAAKKMILTHRKSPHSLPIWHWILSYLDVIYLELSNAQINYATEFGVFCVQTHVIQICNVHCTMLIRSPSYMVCFFNLCLILKDFPPLAHFLLWFGSYV